MSHIPGHPEAPHGSHHGSPQGVVKSVVPPQTAGDPIVLSNTVVDVSTYGIIAVLGFAAILGMFNRTTRFTRSIPIPESNDSEK